MWYAACAANFPVLYQGRGQSLTILSKVLRYQGNRDKIKEEPYNDHDLAT